MHKAVSKAVYKAVLCVGSNVADAEHAIDEALSALSDNGCRIIADSGSYMVSAPYVNRVVAVSWRGEYDMLVLLTKGIERDMGRTPQMKSAGIVPIDIDVVTFDGEVMRPRDFAADYFTAGYQLVTADNVHSI